MANKDIRTNVIVSAETKGFETAQQKSAKLTSESAKSISAQAKGFQDVQNMVVGLQKHLMSLTREQESTTKAMGKMTDKASPAYKNLVNRLKSITTESKSAASQISSLTKAFAEQNKEMEKSNRISEQRKGAFAQGLAQGGLPFPAPFLQRGPGMGRQALGMGVGMALTGGYRGAQAAGGMAFGGVQGMAQGLGAIPGVGGILAGQFMTAAGYAQQNLQWQQTKLSQIPYMEGAGDIMERRRVRLSSNKAYQKATQQMSASEQDVGALISRASYLEERAKLVERINRGDLVSGPEIRKITEREVSTREPVTDYFKRRGGRSLRKLGRRDITRESPELLRLQARQMDEEIANALDDQREATKKLARVEQKAFKGAVSPLTGIAEMGAQLAGVSQQEALQMAGAMTQAGGGYFGEARQQGMISAGFAARTMYGIGPDVSGAFLGAGRRGGLVGAKGESGKAFKEALADGLKMGLEGSELNRWMQETAQGIQQFRSTGIEINTRSITELAGDISGAGITGTRATTMAQTFQRGLQGIGQKGIQSGLDHMMLQLIGGYRGGGAAEYRAARSRMETMSNTVRGQGVGGVATSSKISESLKQIMRFTGGDTASQNEMLQQVLQQYGVRGSVQEFDWLGRSLRGEEATPRQLSAIQAEQARQARRQGDVDIMQRPGGLETAARTAVGVYAPGVRSQARITNQQIAIGGKMVSIVQGLERSSINTTKAFSTLTNDTLKSLVTGLEKLTQTAMNASDVFAQEGFMQGVQSVMGGAS